MLTGAGALCFAYSSAIALPSVYHAASSVVIAGPAPRGFGVAVEEGRASEGGINISSTEEEEDGAEESRTARRRTTRGLVAAAISSALICALYVTTSLLSVFAWGSHCKSGDGNVLYLIPAENLWVTFWCFVLIVAIVLLYPIINFPLVSSIDTVLMLVLRQTPGSAECREWVALAVRRGGVCAWLLRKRRAIISILAATCVLALDCGSGKSLVVLFGLAGSLGVGTSCIVLPAVLYLAHFGVRRNCARGIVAVLVGLVGVVVTVCSTTAVIKAMVSS